MSLSGKDIFVPRNQDRFEDLKKPYLEKGYKSEEIFVGDIGRGNINNEMQKNLKIVIGNVDFAYGQFGYIPFKKLVEVTGYFSCSDNRLTSLKGCPKKVGGNFYCYDNELKTLVGAPEYVDGDFNCLENKLTSLEGSPKYVGGNVLCYKNPNLKSTKGIGKVNGKLILPDKFYDRKGDLRKGDPFEPIYEDTKGKDIFVPRNPERYEELKKPYIDKGYKPEQIFVGNAKTLEELKDIKIVIGDVRLSGIDTNIVDLEKLPFDLDEVVGNFDVGHNQLKSLKGSPKKVTEKFACHNNELRTLEGAPEYVGSNFYCYDNPYLKSLKGIGKVDGDVIPDERLMKFLHQNNYGEIKLKEADLKPTLKVPTKMGNAVKTQFKKGGGISGGIKIVEGENAQPKQIGNDIYISKDLNNLPKDGIKVEHRHNEKTKAGEIGIFAGDVNDVDSGYGKNVSYISIGKNAKIVTISSTYDYLKSSGELLKFNPELKKKYGFDNYDEMDNDAGSLDNPSNNWLERQKKTIELIKKEKGNFDVLEMKNEDELTPHQYIILNAKEPIEVDETTGASSSGSYNGKAMMRTSKPKPVYSGGKLVSDLKFEQLTEETQKSVEKLSKEFNLSIEHILKEVIEPNLKGKDIFVPRNPDRFEDLKKPFLSKGYKIEEIYVGDVIFGLGTETDNILNEILKRTKIVIGEIQIYNGYREKKLPFSLDEVTNDLTCNESRLENLIGLPKKVGGDFNCVYNNKLKTLEGAPLFIGGNFLVKGNDNLISLIGCPKTIVGEFVCKKNQKLKSLEGVEQVGGGVDTDVKHEYGGYTALRPKKLKENLDLEIPGTLKYYKEPSIIKKNELIEKTQKSVGNIQESVKKELMRIGYTSSIAEKLTESLFEKNKEGISILIAESKKSPANDIVNKYLNTVAVKNSHILHESEDPGAKIAINKLLKEEVNLKK